MVDAILDAETGASDVSAEVAYLVKGNDPLLRDRVVDDLVDELLGGDDRTLALEDHTVPGRARSRRRRGRWRRGRSA